VSPPTYSDGTQISVCLSLGGRAASHDRLPWKDVPNRFGQNSSITRAGSRLKGKISCVPSPAARTLWVVNSRTGKSCAADKAPASTAEPASPASIGTRTGFAPACRCRRQRASAQSPAATQTVATTGATQGIHSNAAVGWLAARAGRINGAHRAMASVPAIHAARSTTTPGTMTHARRSLRGALPFRAQARSLARRQASAAA